MTNHNQRPENSRGTLQPHQNHRLEANSNQRSPWAKKAQTPWRNIRQKSDIHNTRPRSSKKSNKGSWHVVPSVE